MYSIFSELLILGETFGDFDGSMVPVPTLTIISSLSLECPPDCVSIVLFSIKADSFWVQRKILFFVLLLLVEMFLVSF